MKITRVEATSHRVPAKVPLLHEPIIREIVFVRMETDGGVTGYGLTGPIQRFAARVRAVREAVGDQVELMVDAKSVTHGRSRSELRRKRHTSSARASQ